MTNFEIYISKRSDRDLYDLVENHTDFPNRSELIRYCLRKYIDEKSSGILSISKKQNRKKGVGQDHISQSLRLLENIAKNKKDSRAITNDLHSNKLQPEVVALTAYLCEKVITIFKNTREIKSTVDYISKHIMTKTDTKSQIKYKVIMDVCPNLITKTVQQSPDYKQKNQSKIYQYPRPPPIKQEEIDDLEEIIPGQNQDNNQEEQENELII